MGIVYICIFLIASLKDIDCLDNIPIGPIATTGICGRDKGCLRFKGVSTTSKLLEPSKDCNQDTCDALATYRLSERAGVSVIEIELEAKFKEKDANPSISIAFSDDNKMGDDFTFTCYADSSGAQAGALVVKALTGYTSGEPTRKHTFTGVGDISEFEGYFNLQTVSLFCRLVHPAARVSNPLNRFTKDLRSRSYYVFLAAAPSLERAPGTNEPTGVKYHDARKAIGLPEGRDLPDVIDLTIYRAPAPGDPAIGQVDARGRRLGPVRATYKWHGCIMLVAWLLCAPIAILLARYYRWTLPFAHLLLGSKIWFQLHRALQIVLVVLNCAAFILIFIVVGGYAKISGFPDAAHPIIGIIVTACILVNLVIGLLHPRGDNQYRPFFNWFHWGIGTIAHVLAVANLFLGLQLDEMAMPEWPFWLLVIWLLIHIVVELALEVHTWLEHERYRKKHAEELKLKTEAGTEFTVYTYKPVQAEPRSHLFRQILIALYIPCAIIVTIILVVVIATL